MYMRVCVCVCASRERQRERESLRHGDHVVLAPMIDFEDFLWFLHVNMSQVDLNYICNQELQF